MTDEVDDETESRPDKAPDILGVLGDADDHITDLSAVSRLLSSALVESEIDQIAVMYLADGIRDLAAALRSDIEKAHQRAFDDRETIVELRRQALRIVPTTSV